MLVADCRNTSATGSNDSVLLLLFVCAKTVRDRISCTNVIVKLLYLKLLLSEKFIISFGF
jgi:hypothetical protein